MIWKCINIYKTKLSKYLNRRLLYGILTRKCKFLLQDYAKTSKPGGLGKRRD